LKLLSLRRFSIRRGSTAALDRGEVEREPFPSETKLRFFNLCCLEVQNQ